MNLELLAQQLSESPDYKVLRRLQTLPDVRESASGETCKIVLADTESTGLDTKEDVIIDIGLLALEVGIDSGRVVRVLDTYAALEDPGREIPANITALTGITNEMVRGKRIDEQRLSDFLAGTSMMVAHNAAFDRQILEQRCSHFDNLPWACSLKEIDWRVNGYGSAALEFLAYKTGVFYDGHRALVDCHALAHVLEHALLPATGQGAMLHLMHKSMESEYRVFANNAPFEVKDILKGHGYRWDGDLKLWHKSLVGLEALEEESGWLKETIYPNRAARVQVETRDALTKYSTRPAPTEWRSLGAQGEFAFASGRSHPGAGRI